MPKLVVEILEKSKRPPTLYFYIFLSSSFFAIYCCLSQKRYVGKKERKKERKKGEELQDIKTEFHYFLTFRSTKNLKKKVLENFQFLAFPKWSGFSCCSELYQGALGSIIGEGSKRTEAQNELLNSTATKLTNLVHQSFNWVCTYLDPKFVSC